jgi:aminopeptidase N
MKTFFTFSLLTLFFAQFPAQYISSTKEFIENELKSYEKMIDFNVNPNTLNYDLQYQRLDISLDPAVNFISGSATTHFLSKESMSSIYFDFSEKVPVSKVVYHGTNINFQQLSTKELKIDFPTSVPTNTLDSLTIHYAGVPDNYSRTSFYVGTHNGSPVLSTLSEPYGAQNWFPTKQSLNDKIDRFDFKITIPDQYSVAANGLLMYEIPQPENKKLTFWRTQYPMAAYLAAFSIGNFTKINDTIGSTNFPFVNYIYPDTYNNSLIVDNIAWTKVAMSIFETHFGPYPFANEKYGHMEFAVNGAAMEHQTMSSMNSLGRVVIAHELAHQWFGDKITCGAWNDAWLNEGFATFGEHLVFEKNLNTPAEFRGFLRAQLNSVVSLPGGSVYVADAGLANVPTVFSGRLTYRKGGYALRMIKWILGDDVFYQMLKDYSSNPNFAYQYAKTEDFKNQILTSTGKDFTGFFEDWIYGEGYPIYTIRWNQPIANSAVKFLISQTQSHPSVDFFDLPLPVRVTGRNGEIANLVLNNTENNQSFSELINFEVASVSFNDDLQIVEKDATIIYDSSLTTTNFNNNKNLVLYPNPVRNDLFLSGIPKKTAFEIYSLDGKLVMKGNYSPQNFINVSKLTKGLYLLKIVGKAIKFQKD